MFEYDQETVASLLDEDDDFKRLYTKHEQLKQQVKEANIGINSMDDYSLEILKKEKLLLKDLMAIKIAGFREVHA